MSSVNPNVTLSVQMEGGISSCVSYEVSSRPLPPSRDILGSPLLDISVVIVIFALVVMHYFVLVIDHM